MKNLIGICGLIGSGKSTVGEILIENGFKKDSFAKPLKDCVSIIFNWDREMMEGLTDESRAKREEVDMYWTGVIGKNFTPRLAMQLFGTECIREVFHQDVWVAGLIKRWEDDGKKKTVITDCRFRNEIDFIQKYGGQVWFVKRGSLPWWYDLMVEYNTLKYKKDKDDDEKAEFMYQKIVMEDLRMSNKIPHISETDWVGANFDMVIDNNGTLEQLKNMVNRNIK